MKIKIKELTVPEASVKELTVSKASKVLGGVCTPPPPPSPLPVPFIPPRPSKY